MGMDKEIEWDSIHTILEENKLLRKEIQVAREAAKITADLVVKQFEETEKILNRFQIANAQRKAVLNSASQIAIIATDDKGTIIVFNTGAENILGYQNQEVIGKETPELFLVGRGKKEYHRILHETREQKQTGKFHSLDFAGQEKHDEKEWIFVRKDKSHFPGRMSVNTLRDADGRISGLLLIVSDISEKKRSEKALKESERNYRLLLNNLPNVVFKGYADGTIDFIDDKIKILTGYSKEEFLSGNKKWFDIVVPEDLEYVREKFVQSLKSNKTYLREYRIRSKKGEIFWIEEGGQIICDRNGSIEVVIGAFLNITERKEAEAALYESEDKYRSLFNSGPNPIIVLDRETLKILDVNPRAEETYGYPKDQLRGRYFTEFGTFERDDKKELRIQMSEWPEDGVVVQKLQNHKGGGTLYIRIKVSPTVYKGRDAIILAGTDITELIEKDAQLIQASKMATLGEMSAGMAHELNQPLNTIKIGNEYLKMLIEKKGQVRGRDIQQIASEMNDQVDRASDIINRLRAFGRKTEFTKEPVDINEPVKGVLKIIGQQLNLEGIRVDLHLESGLPPVLAQHNRMEQILFNLIMNARDAINKQKKTDAGGREHVITIRTCSEGDKVGLSISDTGTGVPESIKNKIFEPFFTTKEVGEGMGLGLSIIYGIIRDFGGEISMQSEEGKGTTFKYVFPCAPVDLKKY